MIPFGLPRQGSRDAGSDKTSGSLFSYVDVEEVRIPARHPLRTIRGIVTEVLAGLDTEFAKLYATTGRESIAPEWLLRASLLQAFYSIRLERQLMEQLDYNRGRCGVGPLDLLQEPRPAAGSRCSGQVPPSRPAPSQGCALPV